MNSNLPHFAYKIGDRLRTGRHVGTVTHQIAVRSSRFGYTCSYRLLLDTPIPGNPGFAPMTTLDVRSPELSRVKVAS